LDFRFRTETTTAVDVGTGNTFSGQQGWSTTTTAGANATTLTIPFNPPRRVYVANPVDFGNIAEGDSPTSTPMTFRTVNVANRQELNNLQAQLNQESNYIWSGGNSTANWTVTTGLTYQKSKILDALTTLFKHIPKELRKDMTDDEKLMEKAKLKSEKLLRSWLSAKEYEGLKINGEIEIPSEFDDETIFIVKRNPDEMVEVKKKGQRSHKLCVVAEDKSFPVGDQLLSKIMLIKTNEKAFKELAVKYN